MSLGTGYELDCPIAKALDVVGERWTLLILRDLFLGLRRYSDFRKRTGIAPAVLTQRLNRLAEEGIVVRVPGPGVHDEYELTPRGERLWPVVHALAYWGDENYMKPESRQPYTHRRCGTALTEGGLCRQCGVVPPARDVIMQPRPTDVTGAGSPNRPAQPHRMLEPLRL
jgi:DNA-binding HxlR family transcriptional regulator